MPFLLLLLALSALSASAADPIHGCGGFVEASSSLIKARRASDPKLDYSDITVELQTSDGLIKERTQCAPNGYYFIPVYDKGSFVIKVKGPNGWSWSPNNVPVVIDENGCNSNADINFRFTGFVISGKVKGAVGGESCPARDGGPSDVKVDLLSPSGDVVSSVLTSKDGSYSFKNILPGKYQIQASHQTLEVKLRGSSEVELTFGNIEVDDIFSVFGYDVRGFVVAQGNPILGVHIYLYSNDVVDVPCSSNHGSAPGRENALCHAVTDVDGGFTFNSVPCGIYELLPYYKGENTTFDVSPSSLIVPVGHQDVTIDQSFKVTGFSVGGRVIDGKGDGVDDVKIIVDGQLRALTDNQGYYKLDQVTSKHYSIVAEKMHYKFRSLEKFLVLPNMAAIANIEAVAYDLCGAVHMVTVPYKAKVALAHGPENVKPQVVTTDKNGRFCFEVSDGEYRLSAVSAGPQDHLGVIFSPPYIDVVVRNPVHNVEFSQAQVNVYGTVKCKDKCSSLISLSLISSHTKGSEARKALSLGDDSNDFMFTDVFPGRYQLEVKHSTPGVSEDDWCWDQSMLQIDVGSEDKKGIILIQKGYWTNIMSTHEVQSSILQPDSSLVDLHIKRGSQRICIEFPGEHELRFIDSCISFGSSSLKFNTLNPSPIHITGEKYLLKGEIYIPSSAIDDQLDAAQYVVVDVLNEEHALVDTVKISFAHSDNGQSGTSVYQYSIWSRLNENLIFVPRDTRDSGEKRVLFYPREQHVSVLIDGCQPTISPILGRQGLYIEGSVSPAISDVNIRILAESSSNNAPLGKGVVAAEVKTDLDGSFVAGPLYDDTTYIVEASKAGYHLKPVGSNSFSCQKLSQIFVRIYSEESKEPFPSVLLSLSGEDGYRNNTVTGTGGVFIFGDLFPGSFYLRPLLKEYSFSPPAQGIELGSGEAKEVTFKATRVAYSVFGTVSLLSGQPKEGVYLEARSDSKGYYEQTTTDSLGNYRLRGLLPHTTYLIRVAAKKDLGNLGIERTSPESVAVEVGTEDIRGVDFVAFEKPEMTILSGHVEGTGLEELHKHLSVEVRSASEPSKIESIFPLPLSYYFEVRNLPKGKHLVQLVSHFPSSTLKFQSESFEVDLEERPQVHIGALGFSIDEYHQKQDLTPAPVFPLIVGVSVIALFISIPRLKDLSQLVVGLTQGSLSASNKKEIRRPAPRKRAY